MKGCFAPFVCFFLQHLAKYAGAKKLHQTISHVSMQYEGVFGDCGPSLLLPQAKP